MTSLRYFVGIDLGSTTTKSVVLDEEGRILGRGITNSRSNYEVACEVASGEALIDARFGLIERDLKGRGVGEEECGRLLKALELRFREKQYRAQLDNLCVTIRKILDERKEDPAVVLAADTVLSTMNEEVSELYAEGSSRKSDFFRDLAGSRYLSLAESEARGRGVPYDLLVGLYDKAILEVENMPAAEDAFAAHASAALADLEGAPEALGDAIAAVRELEMIEGGSVGTGYGRQTLPFPKESIRSEILCHGLGAHAMFPGTRTVLDIGGQDTKAIQVDENGIVTSFQMNDRCAAGCGRYLGYIADEMNLGLHELGPLACESNRPVKINSTCTVFAGAELRERLSLGEKREDILAGLHRAIILRAMSLLARSGGIEDEFTFTGGVAKNEAAVNALRELVRENYGDKTINISPDSIYTGALGAALFCWRDHRRTRAA